MPFLKVNSLEIIRTYIQSGRIIFFDVETTGISAKDDQACQLATVEYFNGKQIKTSNYYIIPSCPISEGAENAHHLSLEFLKENGKPPITALAPFIKDLAENCLLVGHNAHFALDILKNTWEKAGIPINIEKYNICDITDLIEELFPKDHIVFTKSRYLKNLLKLLHIKGRHTYNAAEDVFACANLFLYLVENAYELLKRNISYSSTPGILSRETTAKLPSPHNTKTSSHNTRGIPWEEALNSVTQQLNINISSEFKNIFAQLINDNEEPLFLTGAAGTGKTTLMNCLLNAFPLVYPNSVLLKCAATGVAANLLNGRTIHSQFQFPPREYSPTSNLLQKNSFKITNFYKSVKMLIIDEVSMVRPDLIDAINQTLQKLREISDKPFGGVKVIFVGDLGQLPPVYKFDDENNPYYKRDYGSENPYFFDAHILEKYKNNLASFVISLKTIYRQHELSFVNALTHLRCGKLKTEDIRLFTTCYKQINKTVPLLNRTTLFSINKRVNKTNSICLSQLPTKAVQIKGIFTYHIDENEKPNLYALAKKLEKSVKDNDGQYPFILDLKEGARVMLLKNNKQNGYYNGSFAIIESFCEENNEIISIKVKLLETGNTVEVSRERQEFFEILQVNGEKKKITYATFEQFPLKLAWAITVHKSQGQTYSELFMDLREAFECGQVYTAFSRVKTLAGLRLLSPFTPDTVYVDERIRPFL